MGFFMVKRVRDPSLSPEQGDEPVAHAGFESSPIWHFVIWELIKLFWHQQFGYHKNDF
jgi:hypothetical protein